MDSKKVWSFIGEVGKVALGVAIGVAVSVPMVNGVHKLLGMGKAATPPATPPAGQ